MQLSSGKLQLLKQGSQSHLYLFQKGDLELVLKAIESNSIRQVNHLLNEWSILSQLQHQNVVEVYRCMKKVTLPQKEGNYYILAQEYADKGNLAEVVRKYGTELKMSQRRFMIWELARALQYIHCKDIVHRDIKLDNVLVADHEDGVTVKLADFGFAQTVDSASASLVGHYKGTKRGYMAPEIHAAKTDQDLRYDGKAADMFAFGVVIYAVMMGRLPFEFSTAEDRHYKLLISCQTDEFWMPLSPILTKLEQDEDSMVQQFKDLFIGLVSCNPKQRLKIEEVLQHPWMLGRKQRPFF